jgi:hypothetical protein
MKVSQIKTFQIKDKKKLQKLTQKCVFALVLILSHFPPLCSSVLKPNLKIEIN